MASRLTSPLGLSWGLLSLMWLWVRVLLALHLSVQRWRRRSSTVGSPFLLLLTHISRILNVFYIQFIFVCLAPTFSALWMTQRWLPEVSLMSMWLFPRVRQSLVHWLAIPSSQRKEISVFLASNILKKKNLPCGVISYSKKHITFSYSMSLEPLTQNTRLQLRALTSP